MPSNPLQRTAPCVTESQALILRRAKKDGRVRRSDDAGRLQSFDCCRRNRWLAPRGATPMTEHHVITDGGLAALAHFDADVAMENLWKGLRG